MKIISFKQFVKEEPSLDLIRTGVDSKSLDNPNVKAMLNSNLAKATRQEFITPYIGLGAAARVLAYANIILPQYTFLDTEGGVAVFDATPIADLENSSNHFVYFEYEQNVDGTYTIYCALVDTEELRELLEDEEEDEGGEEEKVGELDESLKLKKTYTNGPHTAKVYKDSEWNEHRVKYFKNGQHQVNADYHCDDAEDAHATAQHELNRLSKE